jgi:hypothetical protein
MTFWVAGAIAVGTIGSSIIGSDTASSAAQTQAQGATQSAQIAANAQMQGLQFVQQQEAPFTQAGQLALGRYEQLLGLTPQSTGASGAGLPQVVSPGVFGAGIPGGSKTIQNPSVASTERATGGLVGALPGQGATPGQIGSSGTAGGQSLSDYFNNLPGYKFEQQQGQQAIQNSAAARGQSLSGNTLQGLEQFGQGLAST